LRKSVRIHTAAAAMLIGKNFTSITA